MIQFERITNLLKPNFPDVTPESIKQLIEESTEGEIITEGKQLVSHECVIRNKLIDKNGKTRTVKVGYDHSSAFVTLFN